MSGFNFVAQFHLVSLVFCRLNFSESNLYMLFFFYYYYL